jgi:hypothetical protein
MTLTMMNGGVKVESVVTETPSYVVTPRFVEETKPRIGMQRKHVFIMIGSVILAGLIITGILVGMHIFAEAQKEIVKFSLDFKSSNDGKDVKQDVESDPNDNVVMYHITKDGKNIDIVNDFNREIQVVKMESDYGTNCYVSALNRSAAMDPSQITGPDSDATSDRKNGGATVFSISSSPISDRSFLSKKALDMCKSVSVYWAYRSCNKENVDESNMNNTSTDNDRQRRAIYNAGYYRGLPCLNGCCYTMCSCSVRIVEVRVGTQLTCYYYNYCSSGYYLFRQATPGVYC